MLVRQPVITIQRVGDRRVSACEQMDARFEQYNTTFHANRAFVRKILRKCASVVPRLDRLMLTRMTQIQRVAVPKMMKEAEVDDIAPTGEQVVAGRQGLTMFHTAKTVEPRKR